jgi:hypothetical protein
MVHTERSIHDDSAGLDLHCYGTRPLARLWQVDICAHSSILDPFNGLKQVTKRRWKRLLQITHCDNKSGRKDTLVPGDNAYEQPEDIVRHYPGRVFGQMCFAPHRSFDPPQTPASFRLHSADWHALGSVVSLMQREIGRQLRHEIQLESHTPCPRPYNSQVSDDCSKRGGSELIACVRNGTIDSESLTGGRIVSMWLRWGFSSKRAFIRQACQALTPGPWRARASRRAR